MDGQANEGTIERMADDPLDEWRRTLVDDTQRVKLLPKGQVKNLLNQKLRELADILGVVGALPENQPFRCRVEDIARLMKETPSRTSKVLKEFADCVKIARSMKRRKAALNAKRRWSQKGGMKAK